MELHTKELFNSMLLFALLALIIFNFAFAGEMPIPVMAGSLWVAFVFASVLGLNRSFVREQDKGCLEGLLLCPADRSVIYFGKMLGNLVFLLIIEAISVPLYIILFNRSELLDRPLELIGIPVLGSIAISSVGTIISAITINTRTRELLLPILLFPLLIPVIIAAVELTAFLLDPTGNPRANPRLWLNMLVIYDIIFVIVPYITFDYVVEE